MALPVAAALALLGGCAALAVAAGRSLGPAEDAVSGYGQALTDGRFEDAYAMLCTASQHRTPLAAFLQHFSAGPDYTGQSVDELNVRDDNGHLSGDAVLSLRTADGFPQSVQLTLVHEDGRWKPCP